MPSAAVPVPGFGDFAAIARATELESPKDPLGASSPTPSVACPLHAHTTARFFCVTCSVACCGTCVVTSHADDAHDTLPTADACEHFLGALSTLSTSMRAGHVAISSLLPSFHHLASHCSPRALPSFSSLRTGVDDVIASLGRARDRFVGDARARCAAAQKLLIAQQEELG